MAREKRAHYSIFDEVTKFAADAEEYVQAVAMLLAEQIGEAAADARVLQRLATVLEAMIEGTSPDDTALTLKEEEHQEDEDGEDEDEEEEEVDNEEDEEQDETKFEPLRAGEEDQYRNERHEERCPDCGGSGEIEESCGHCRGSGRSERDPTRDEEEYCSYCSGSGTAEVKCRTCGGTGYV
jgi:hypothetical protein